MARFMEHTSQRAVQLHICPAGFAKQYELQANDPGHEARVPERSLQLHTNPARFEKANVLSRWLLIATSPTKDRIEGGVVGLMRRLAAGSSLGLQGLM